MSGMTVAAPPGERLRLDHNERLFPAPELVRLLPEVPASALTRYPDASRLEQRLAEASRVGKDRVLVTAGADDAIDRVCRRYLAGGRELITVAPTFEMVPTFAALAGGRVRSIPTLNDPAPLGPILDRLGERTGLVAVISPHNPTGTVAPVERILAIADSLPANAALLADLAYVEFADRDPTRELLQRDNILVVRTLSKAWGLAGLRVGFVLGPPAVIEGLRAGGAPFPLSAPSIWLAERALALGDRVTATYVAAVCHERERLVSALLASAAEPFASQANFVLATTDRAAALHRRFRQQAIAIRRFPNFPDLVRITLPGDEATFRRVLRVLDTLGHIS
ncbi:histidinol-phosphate transaminase [Candidatus Palauibacter soopunensis]|uniref:pyridoxal phosphate-dependent aminotransferase n=1 Tax=Candidatus Palauibacter soopunensis TaxID=3056739 RepID=UPI002384E743|nr:histidinol-phosphate transaminase [Candidatus Palauibacter soopunensis]MDE2879018.1 histidinol-phosphate transaminase [Candidatus Palauibacter soopunensis]